jgi:short subunit dehydrogenase-like uncharacterized protein
MWLLYGANGYTGKLIAREAARRGMRPVLAGRDAASIEPLGRTLGLETRVFPLDDPSHLARGLSGVSAVLHCAGPFAYTSAPMLRACLEAGASYLDITGEIAVFERVFRLDDEAKRRGVALIPGVGFDVVPTDCLAAMLARRMPNADELWLAFYASRGAISRGTLKTMIEGLGEGGAIRRDGKIVRVPVLFDVREIPFGNGPRLAMTIPWGDVSTAYRTTGIPNIRVYTGTSRATVRRMRRIRPFLPIASFTPVKRLLQLLASRRSGPDEATRTSARTFLWGRVARKSGEELIMTMATPDGYGFTVLSALAAIERLEAAPVRAGSWTPATYFGADFVTTIPGVTID